jgi:capsular exopolysaccharide synthesis family protein
LADIRSAQIGLIAHLNPGSPVAEAYRALRTNVQFANAEKPVRTLLITSAEVDEGKSTTAANLAVTLAQTGAQTILVDCDLRRPILHQIFGLGNQSGLSTLIPSQGAGLSELQNTAVPNLRLLTSGPLPANPSELLCSGRMQEILQLLRQEAEYVILDAPPVTVVTDGAVLASKADGALLVISAGRTKRDLARRAKAALEKVNANVLGVVMNNVKLDGDLYRYYSARS